MKKKSLLVLICLIVIGGQVVKAQEVTSFTLMNAQTNNEIGTLNEGDEINLRETGSELNIRANTSGSVGSVRFWLDGVQKNTESTAPYAMTGDVNGNYNVWTPSLGAHVVKATPYAEAGGNGTEGTSLTVNFTVTNSSDPIEHPVDSGTGEVTISGQLKKWHKVSLSFNGPAYKETANDPNPFLDYRLEVTFSNGSRSYIVPGYFATDGNAAESSADSGNVWRVHFSPDTIGTWNYQASFYIGRNIAVEETAADMAEIPPIHGKTGSFVIADTDKTGRDNRAKGRLQYVGEHFLRYAETGEYFIKGGPDAPENFLAYEGFDGEFKTDGVKDDLIKTWSGHIDDWNTGDPVWKGDKGKGIIGAVNYLASEDLNVFSFLTMNIGGDDRNVYPYVNSSDLEHFDCSKLDQWEIVFQHADSLGMYLHFKTQETENDDLLDGGNVGIKRKLYYRELIARYGHHLALNWNMGEENTQTAAQRRNMATFFKENDPYRHHVVIHTFPNQIDQVYSALVGNQSDYTGVSIQTGWNNVYNATLKWVSESAKSGRKWVVANDEQGSANIGVPEDDYTGTPNKDDIRKNVLWGNYMAGGAGVEYYFGYQRPNSDLDCEDFRSRDISWDYVRYAKNLFDDTVKYWEMSARNELTSSGWALAKEGEMILIYLPDGGTANVTIRDRSDYMLRWFDPRNGGSLQETSLKTLSGRGVHSIGTPPDNTSSDWAALVYRIPADTVPVAEFSTNAVQGQVPLSIQFDASLSDGGNASIVDYYWYFGDGDTAKGVTVNHVYDKAGEYQVALVIENEKGEVDYAYTTISATGIPDSPCGEQEVMLSKDFPYSGTGFYLDTYTDYDLLAINPGTPGSEKSATVSKAFTGESCLYHVVFHGVGESDGQSEYSIYVAGRHIGDVTLPLSTQGWEVGPEYTATFENIPVKNGEQIKVVGKTASADGQEWSRARWLKVEFIPVTYIADYLEKDGLVIIEAESFDLTGQWVKENSLISNYTGSGYIKWTGSEYFNNASNGRIHVKVHITNPGIYIFDWRVGVGFGNSATEHNDTWLNIEADNFYGFRSQNNSYINPKPLCNTSEYACPDGSSVDNYFKLFGGGLRNWVWKAVTSDFDDHKIYAKFDSPGVYQINIAARSSHHCIDRMVLYNPSLVSESQARNLATPETSNPIVSVRQVQSQPVKMITIFPNPANDRVFIAELGGTEQVYLLNQLGQIVFEQYAGGHQISFNTSGLPSGMYFVLVRDSLGNSVTKQLVIQK